jgi:hypothetical protein
MVQRYVDVLTAAGQPVDYIQVEGAGHAFFDWKPDATTRATFAKYGVPYAAQMQTFSIVYSLKINHKNYTAYYSYKDSLNRVILTNQ